VTWTPEIYRQARSAEAILEELISPTSLALFSRSSQEFAIKIAALTLLIQFHSEWQTIDIERQ
jgi:hypothetical protein